MVWPAIIGGVLSAAGSILPGIIKKKKKINPILQRVNWGKQAGIHPLVALGANVNWDNWAQSPYGWGDALGAGLQELGDVGSYIDSAMERESEREDRAEYERYGRMERAQDRSLQSARDRLDKARIEAEITEARSRTALNEAKLRVIGATGGLNISDPNQPIRLGIGELDTTVSGMSPAQTVQNEYGDFAESVYGVGKFLTDAVGNVIGELRRQSPEELRKIGGF